MKVILFKTSCRFWVSVLVSSNNFLRTKLNEMQSSLFLFCYVGRQCLRNNQHPDKILTIQFCIIGCKASLFAFPQINERKLPWGHHRIDMTVDLHTAMIVMLFAVSMICQKLCPPSFYISLISLSA